MQNLTHVTLRKWNLRTERPIFTKGLIYRRRPISWPMTICIESGPIGKPKNLLLGPWLDFPLIVLLASKPSTDLPITLLQHVFPELQFLCYSWTSSISGNLSFLTSLFRFFIQFTSLFRLIVQNMLMLKMILYKEWDFSLGGLISKGREKHWL